jgi:hypothetical protein
MKTSDITKELVGKRVKCITIGEKCEGTIIDIVEEHDPVTGKLCSKGVKIKLDKPVQWGDDLYDVNESTARVSDEQGNLQYTELI